LSRPGVLRPGKQPALPSFNRERLASSIIAPASATTTAAASTAPTAARTASTASAAFPWGAGFVHYQGSALKVFAVARLNGARRIVIVADLSEREAPRLAGKSVPDDVHMIHFDSSLPEPLLQVHLGCLIGYVTHVKFHV
jgi:hypothetical protein